MNLLHDAWALALSLGAGSVLGHLITWRTARAADAAKFRRDWLVEVVRERRAFYGEVVVAMSELNVVLRQGGHARFGGGAEVSGDRVRTAIDGWRSILARSRIVAVEDVQHAVAAFDVAQANCAAVINTGDVVAWKTADEELDRHFKLVANAINGDVDHINQALAPHLIPKWRRLRGDKPPRARRLEP